MFDEILKKLSQLSPEIAKQIQKSVADGHRYSEHARKSITGPVSLGLNVAADQITAIIGKLTPEQDNQLCQVITSVYVLGFSVAMHDIEGGRLVPGAESGEAIHDPLKRN